MAKKQIILLAVIIISLSGAIFMAFLTWQQLSPGKNKTSNQNPSVATSAILPYGAELDLQSLQQFNVNKKLFPYPVVNSAEIGTPLNNLVK